MNLPIDAMRIRSFPFSKEITDFISDYEKIIVIDQNRDGQLRSLLLIEEDIDPQKLLSVRMYDGLPVTAEDLTSEFKSVIEGGPMTYIPKPGVQHPGASKNGHRLNPQRL